MNRTGPTGAEPGARLIPSTSAMKSPAFVLLVAVERDAEAPLAPLEHRGDRLETGEIVVERAADLDLEIADAVALEVVLERLRQAVGDRLAHIRRGDRIEETDGVAHVQPVGAVAPAETRVPLAPAAPA